MGKALTCIALDAQNSATRELLNFKSAMCPPSFMFCSSLDMVFIWNVTFSSHAFVEKKSVSRESESVGVLRNVYEGLGIVVV